jgi:hypothetical protein
MKNSLEITFSSLFKAQMCKILMILFSYIMLGHNVKSYRAFFQLLIK